MNKKTIVIIGVLTLMMIMLAIAAYFLFIDIQSKVPKTIEEKYEIQITKYDNRNVFTICPKQGKNEQYILYFHGGSYMAEMTDDHWKFLDRLMQETGNSVIVPDYPLTPKYNYKDVFEMVVPMYQEILQKIPPENIIMMGDSAGGGLALALEEKLGEEGIEVPNQLILISPWLDVTMSNPEIEEYQKNDKNLNKEALKVAGMAYSGADGMESYLVNPIKGPVHKLKNVTIYTGMYDILNPDARKFAERAKEEGVEITIKEYEEAEHIWLIYQEGELAEQAFRDLIGQITKF